MWLALALIAAILADQVLLPVTVDWAADWGVWGRMVWILWACTGLAAIHEVLARPRPSAYPLHVAAGLAVYMAVAAPGGWGRAVLAATAAIGIWLILYLAARRTWPTTRTRRTR